MVCFFSLPILCVSADARGRETAIRRRSLLLRLQFAGFGRVHGGVGVWRRESEARDLFPRGLCEGGFSEGACGGVSVCFFFLFSFFFFCFFFGVWGGGLVRGFADDILAAGTEDVDGMISRYVARPLALLISFLFFLSFAFPAGLPIPLQRLHFFEGMD